MTNIHVTDEASSLIKDIQEQRDQELAVILNDGCCDGMGPVLTEKSMIGGSDEYMGIVNEIEIYTTKDRKEIRSDYDIKIDIERMKGVGSFSLEVPTGYRLTTEEAEVKSESSDTL